MESDPICQKTYSTQPVYIIFTPGFNVNAPFVDSGGSTLNAGQPVRYQVMVYFN